MILSLVSCGIAARSAPRAALRRPAARNTRAAIRAAEAPTVLELDAAAAVWAVGIREADALNGPSVEVYSKEVAWEVRTVRATIERSAASPGIGLILVEAGAADDASGLGLVLVEGVADGSNAARLPAGSVLAGDVLIGAGLPGGVTKSTEGFAYDQTVAVLQVRRGAAQFESRAPCAAPDRATPPPPRAHAARLPSRARPPRARAQSLDPAAGGVELVLKRLVKRPALAVTLQFPQSDARADARITLYSGAGLRRSMLASGVDLNDQLARRFDAGIGTGDCGGEGCCCTCAVEVVKGMDCLSPISSQERQMLARFPRWRLACKTSIERLDADAELVLRVTPRGFDGFYNEVERDANGKLLKRGV